MIEFENLEEVAEYLDLDILTVAKEYSKQMGQTYVDLLDLEFQNPYSSEYGELVLVDLDSCSDCNEYLMKWVIKDYDWFILRDGELVKVIIDGVYNEGLEINSVRGIDMLDNNVWTECEYAPLKECIVKPDIVYYIDKDDEEE